MIYHKRLLQVLRPDYQYVNQGLNECLNCAIAGIPLPGEDGYISYAFYQLGLSAKKSGESLKKAEEALTSQTITK